MNIKARVYLTALLVAISCQVMANTAVNSKAVTMSHQQILTHLLIADMAIQRNRFDLALENFMLVAESTHNPKVAQAATELALQTQNFNKAGEAAEIWANSAPKDLQAQLVAVTLLISSNQTKASYFLNNAFDLSQPDIDQQLLLILSKLSNAGQKNLTAVVFKIANQRPHNAVAQLAAAQIAAAQLNIGDAESKLKAALHINPAYTAAIELNAKIIRHKSDKDGPALAYLAKQVDKYPKNSELRMFYVTALNDANMIKEATPHLELLAKDKVYGGDALIILGEIAVNQNNIKAAESYIKKALKFESSADKARYYLAQLAEYRNDIPKAIELYENISSDSEFHTAGFLRAAYLYSSNGEPNKALDTLQNSNPTSLADHKQVLLTETDILIDMRNYEEALDNCNRVISVLPNDIDFLYARSVVYGLQNNVTAAEKDLRTILNIEPNNANALNALGFILSNQPSRVNEAMPLLEKAMSINPNNPAFMDSMGWLLFKMGKTQEAINMLNKAYQMSGDNEIAAHLGEVLWSSGQQDAARQIWNRALSSNNDTSVIEDTMQRLNIPPTGLQQKAPAR